MQPQSDFLAHYDKKENKKQSIAEHSESTAKLAKQYSVCYLEDISEYLCMLHDVGKYRDGFQQRILGKSNLPCRHACCGAQEIKRHEKSGSNLFRFIAPMLEYCVSGHHSGLQNGIATPKHSDGTLFDSLNEKAEDIEKYRCFFEDIAVPDDVDLQALISKMSEGCGSNEEAVERYAFFTRYLFSCLTDADFIDTESFYGEAERGLYGDFEKALELINDKLNGFSADSKVNESRIKLQKQAFENSHGAKISILNMPTGSGKTLCSITLALERAVASDKKRIIYVIPYTSIIEQTAAGFEKLFGDTLPVLQHHSNFTPDDADTEIIRRTTENWDASLIVTTNVQFFQSIYHNRSSKLRKLHNMAESIIVFDEVHMMPVEYLQPCLRAVGYITSYLDSEAVFMSATMPDFGKLLSEFCGVRAKELITDKSSFVNFKNCSYADLGELDEAKIIELSDSFESSLIIVNSRQEARKLFNLCGDRNKYHLSTYMTPNHRNQIISEIKSKLGKEKITVISTSLIEAGVDLDFEAVFREMSGLDSIIQSAGRCNREGRRPSGYMHVFTIADSKIPDSLKLKVNICASLMSEFDDISSDECVKEYYKRLYSSQSQTISSNTIYKDGMKPQSIPFRDYSESFNFIDSDSINIIIPCEENRELLESAQFSRAALRKLAPYCASVHYYEFNELIDKGIVSPCGNAYKLEIPEYYDKDTGLYPKYEPCSVL